jgi:hypothetical protein
MKIKFFINLTNIFTITQAMLSKAKLFYINCGLGFDGPRGSLS